MDKRSFLLGCAAFAALFALSGAGKAPAGQAERSDAQRILRLTRKRVAPFPLFGAKELEAALLRKNSRHLLISLQSRADYEAGHLPNARLFPPEDLADPQKLAAFAQKLPADKNIVLICSNGHLSCAVMLLLRQLGLNASALAFGMNGWNRACAGGGAYRGDIGGEISRSPERLVTAQNPEPPACSELTERALLMRASRARFLNEIAPAVHRERREGLLLCLRRPEDYAAGHIPGAVNIPAEAFLNGDEILTRLPRGRKIILSCYVGHYSCGAALLLTQLGYEAQSLEWGMAGWNNRYLGPILQALTAPAARPAEQGPGRLFMNS